MEKGRPPRLVSRLGSPKVTALRAKRLFTPSLTRHLAHTDLEVLSWAKIPWAHWNYKYQHGPMSKLFDLKRFDILSSPQSRMPCGMFYLEQCHRSWQTDAGCKALRKGNLFIGTFHIIWPIILDHLLINRSPIMTVTKIKAWCIFSDQMGIKLIFPPRYDPKNPW